MAQQIGKDKSTVGKEIKQRYLLVYRCKRYRNKPRLDKKNQALLLRSDAIRSKGSLENKHIELRYILPKRTNLKALGPVNQEALNRVLGHVNSAPVEKLGGKSPLELAEFMYPELYKKLVTSGIRKIEKDKILLRPYFLK